jgi:AraC family transcriptional regulator of adaptative response / DNA-3-methyladenine glycosylase II
MAMPLDPAACERARRARDARFDGRFFVAVASTGIYCRPVCPVQPASADHVRFYATAAAAEAAGFRPCLRCRPEAAPGSAAWTGTGATVTRALRLIAKGALDEGSVLHLAERLGVSDRYLRKLFAAQVGASPAAVARTRRMHLAKQLVDETDLPMATIAEAAGYGSLRRFNAAFREAYGRSPGSLRRRPIAQNGLCRLRLPYRDPWHWRQFRDHFGLRALPGVERVMADQYVRSFRLGPTAGWLSVRPVPEDRELELTLSLTATSALAPVVARVRRMFDLDADPISIGGHLAADPALGPLVTRWPGLRLPSAFDPFEQAVRTILGQQVTVKAAVTVAGRLVVRLGEPLAGGPEGGPDRLFPTPQAIAEGDLGGLGLPGKRVQTLRRLARAIATGEIVLSGEQGANSIVSKLLTLPGIGPWTAQYIALRALGEPDAFPATDLGILKAKAWGSNPLSPREVIERANAWRPWRAYAAVYLWQSYGET